MTSVKYQHLPLRTKTETSNQVSMKYLTYVFIAGLILLILGCDWFDDTTGDLAEVVEKVAEGVDSTPTPTPTSVIPTPIILD